MSELVVSVPFKISGQKQAARVLRVLMGLINPDQPLLSPLCTLPAHGLHLSSALVLQPWCELRCRKICLVLGHSYAWTWTPPIWTLTHRLTSQLDLGLTLSPWTCVAITGLCLTLVIIARPDPDLHIDFLA